MKTILLTLCLLLSASSFAHPFDGFLGNYKVTGPVKIRNENAKDCNRFNLRNLVALKVLRSTHGYQQSHALVLESFQTASAHPIMEYKYVNEFQTAGSYAKTTSTPTSASNELGDWTSNPFERSSLTVTLENLESGTLFTVTEAHYENSRFMSGCQYQASLTKYPASKNLTRRRR